MSNSVNGDNNNNKYIGYWWSEKKNVRFDGIKLNEILMRKGYKFVKLDLNRSFDEQGPFLAFIHKMSDIIVKSNEGDQQSMAILQRFNKYCQNNQEMVCIDPLDRVGTVLDRIQQYKLFVEAEIHCQAGIFAPTFVELRTKDIELNRAKLKQANVTFPCLCKSILAQGKNSAHEMSMVFNEKNLSELDIPCVVQSFVPHNGRMYKLFVIDKTYHVIERFSLRNFQASDSEIIKFSSVDISKAHSNSWMIARDEHSIKKELDKQRLDRIVESLSLKSGLKLYGVDVIIENETDRYAIIDLNIFPGYDGVDNKLELITEMIVNAIKTKKNTNKKKTISNNNNSNSNKKSNTDIDSGIDTSDSCDEKKMKNNPLKGISRQQTKTT